MATETTPRQTSGPSYANIARYVMPKTVAEAIDPVTGLPWSTIQEMVGYYESDNNYLRDDNADSTASGRYQFVDGTAAETLRRLGYGPMRAMTVSPALQDLMFRELWARRGGKDWKASQFAHGNKRGWQAEVDDAKAGVPMEEIMRRRYDYEAKKGDVDYSKNGWWNAYRRGIA